MTTWFISRHKGAIDWVQQKNIKIDFFITHLNENILFKKGDTVYGSLPVGLIYKLNQQGANYVNIELNVPESYRGKELSYHQLNNFGASLAGYEVKKTSVEL